MKNRFKFIAGKHLLIFILVNVIAIIGAILFIKYSAFMHTFTHDLFAAKGHTFIERFFVGVILFPFKVVVLLLMIAMVSLLIVGGANLIYFILMGAYLGKSHLDLESLKEKAANLTNMEEQESTELKNLKTEIALKEQENKGIGVVLKTIGIGFAAFIALIIINKLISSVSHSIKENIAQKKLEKQIIERDALTTLANTITVDLNSYPNILAAIPTEEDKILLATTEKVILLNATSKEEITSWTYTPSATLPMKVKLCRNKNKYGLLTMDNIFIFQENQKPIVIKNHSNTLKPRETSNNVFEETLTYIDDDKIVFELTDNNQIYLQLYQNTLLHWNGKKWKAKFYENSFDYNKTNFYRTNNKTYISIYSDNIFDKKNGLYTLSNTDSEPNLIIQYPKIKYNKSLPSRVEITNNNIYWSASEEYILNYQLNNESPDTIFNINNIDQLTNFKAQQWFNYKNYCVTTISNYKETYILTIDQNDWSYKIYKSPSINTSKNDMAVLNDLLYCIDRKAKKFYYIKI